MDLSSLLKKIIEKIYTFDSYMSVAVSNTCESFIEKTY